MADFISSDCLDFEFVSFYYGFDFYSLVLILILVIKLDPIWSDLSLLCLCCNFFFNKQWTSGSTVSLLHYTDWIYLMKTNEWQNTLINTLYCSWKKYLSRSFIGEASADRLLKSKWPTLQTARPLDDHRHTASLWYRPNVCWWSIFDRPVPLRTFGLPSTQIWFAEDEWLHALAYQSYL